MDAATKREGIWIVAEFDGHRAILARVKTKETKLTPTVKNEICGAKHRVEFEECLDFFGPLRPIQQRLDDGRVMQGITRDPVVTGNHFMLESAPAYVHMGLITKLSFLDEMSEYDQASYTSYINLAKSRNVEQVENIKQASARIVLPKSGVLPLDEKGNLDMSALSRTP